MRTQPGASTKLPRLPHGLIDYTCRVRRMSACIVGTQAKLLWGRATIEDVLLISMCPNKREFDAAECPTTYNGLHGLYPH